jgi:hypothetical protein
MSENFVLPHTLERNFRFRMKFDNHLVWELLKSTSVKAMCYLIRSNKIPRKFDNQNDWPQCRPMSKTPRLRRTAVRTKNRTQAASHANKVQMRRDRTTENWHEERQANFWLSTTLNTCEARSVLSDGMRIHRPEAELVVLFPPRSRSRVAAAVCPEALANAMPIHRTERKSPGESDEN